MTRCEHSWLIERTFVQTSVSCTRCPVVVGEVPWDEDPIEYASRLYPSPSKRAARRRLLRPARIVR